MVETPQCSDAELNPLVAKLGSVASLSADDREAVVQACADVREISENRDIISAGDKPAHVHLVIEGWAARYKLVADGARQITAFLIPGDFCDLHVTILREMDHGIIALTPTKVAFISRDTLLTMTRERPELARALWWASLVDEAVLREWIVNIGRRSAYEGVGHLFCEMHARMSNVGLVADGRFDLPLTQEEIGDSLGLTAVHTNRVLQRLRREGMIELSGKCLTILDVKRLQQAVGFDAEYLHLRG